MKNINRTDQPRVTAKQGLTVTTFYKLEEGVKTWFIGRGEREGKESNLSNPFSLEAELAKIDGLPHDVLAKFRYDAKNIQSDDLAGMATSLMAHIDENVCDNTLSEKEMIDLQKIATGKRKNKQLTKELLDSYARGLVLHKYEERLCHYLDLATQHNARVEKAENDGSQVKLELAELEELKVCRNICRELLSIAEVISEKGQPLQLVCFCAPKRCHGDIISRYVQEHLEGLNKIVMPNSTSKVIVRKI